MKTQFHFISLLILLSLSIFIYSCNEQSGEKKPDETINTDEVKISPALACNLKICKLYIPVPKFKTLERHNKDLILAFNIGDAGDIVLSGWLYKLTPGKDYDDLPNVVLSKVINVSIPYQTGTNLGNLVLTRQNINGIVQGLASTDQYIIFLPSYRSSDNMLTFTVYPSSVLNKDASEALIQFEVNPSPPKNFVQN